MTRLTGGEENKLLVVLELIEFVVDELDVDDTVDVNGESDDGPVLVEVENATFPQHSANLKFALSVRNSYKK